MIARWYMGLLRYSWTLRSVSLPGRHRQSQSQYQLHRRRWAYHKQQLGHKHSPNGQRTGLLRSRSPIFPLIVTSQAEDIEKITAGNMFIWL